MNEWLDAETRVEKAQELYTQGRWVEAAAELRAAIDVNPFNPSWHFNLGLTLEAMEDFDRATEAYRTSLRLQPDDIEALNCLGVNLTRLGRYAESLSCFEKIEKIDPAYEPSYCNRIVTYSEIGQHEEAELMFYLARLFMDECPVCCYNIANSLYARDLVEKAVACWKQALQLDPTHPHVHARLAEAAWNVGDLEQAQRHYQAELEISPDDELTMLDFGELLVEMDRSDQASAMFRKVLHVSPDNAAAHFQLGHLALDGEKYPAAQAYFELCLRKQPDYPGAHCNLARALIRQGQLQQGARHLVDEIRISGSDPDMLHQVGELLIEAKLVHHANNVLRRLVELQPDDPYAQHNLAVTYFMLQRLDDGIRHCRKALKLRPDYVTALYNLALAHLQKGDVGRARRYVSRAMTISPADEKVRELAQRAGGGFWRRLGRWTRRKQQQ